MTTLHLSIINDGETYQRRLNTGFARLAGSIDAKEYRARIQSIVREQAAKERAAFGSKFTLKDIAKATDEVAAYMLTHCKEFFGPLPAGARIHAHIRRWWDKVNGNSYFAVKCSIPCLDGHTREFIIPFDSGYGSQPEWQTMYELINIGVLADPGRYENGNLKGSPGDYPIDFSDAGFVLKRQLWA